MRSGCYFVFSGDTRRDRTAVGAVVPRVGDTGTKCCTSRRRRGAVGTRTAQYTALDRSKLSNRTRLTRHRATRIILSIRAFCTRRHVRSTVTCVACTGRTSYYTCLRIHRTVQTGECVLNRRVCADSTIYTYFGSYRTSAYGATGACSTTPIANSGISGAVRGRELRTSIGYSSPTSPDDIRGVCTCRIIRPSRAGRSA